MARTYTPKKIEVVFEQVEAKPEEIEQRLSDTYSILFEETLKFLREEKQQATNKDTSFKNQNQNRKGVISIEQNFYSR